MGKYGQAAVMAAGLIESNRTNSPLEAWNNVTSGKSGNFRPMYLPNLLLSSLTVCGFSLFYRLARVQQPQTGSCTSGQDFHPIATAHAGRTEITTRHPNYRRLDRCLVISQDKIATFLVFRSN